MSDADKPRDEWGDLDNRLDEDFPQAWRPGWKGKDGKRKAADVHPVKLMGTLVRTEIAGTARGNDVPVLIVAQHPTGELFAVWLVHTTIREDVQRQRLQPGDKLAIRYEGERDSAANPGQTYHAYRLAVMRGNGPAGIAEPAGPAPDAPDFGDTPPF